MIARQKRRALAVVTATWYVASNLLVPDKGLVP
jgi:hypothetical protein